MIGCKEIYELLTKTPEVNIGYKNIRGDRVKELRNVIFEADYDRIVPGSLPYPELDDLKWYRREYMPIFMETINIALLKLKSNSESRQAIIPFISTNPDEYKDNELICTMYVSLRLINKEVLEYTVHMRSSDVIEYITDRRFHEMMIQSVILPYIGISNYKIIWYTDSLHMYI